MIVPAPIEKPPLRTHLVRRGFLSPAACRKVVGWCDGGWVVHRRPHRLENAELNFGADDDVDRLYEKFRTLISEVNVWGVHLHGITRNLMVMKYKPGYQPRKHVDFMPHRGEYDKLAMVVMLSPRSAYAGGELVVDEKVVRLEQGDLICFPGYVMHGVDPVITGERLALICWASGPAFV